MAYTSCYLRIYNFVYFQDYYISESLSLTTRIFNDCLQALGKCANPALAMHHRLNVEALNSIVRVISRLLCYLSDSEQYVAGLIDVDIMGLLTGVQQVKFLIHPLLTFMLQISPTNRTGVEVRIHATKIYANLSTMKEKLRQRELHKPVKFIFDCIHDITGLENNYNVPNLFDVIIYGTGFLSNLAIYHSKVKVSF